MRWLKSKDWITGKKEKDGLVLMKDTRKPKVVEKSEHQTGKSNKARDIVRKAISPGKRISKSGNIYYEYRKNRSDMSGKKI